MHLSNRDKKLLIDALKHTYSLFELLPNMALRAARTSITARDRESLTNTLMRG